MTNEEIVLKESVELMKNGILECAGQVDAVDENGERIKIDMPESIHTYQEWKELGYQVKKGEHAVAKFAIWKPAKAKKNEKEEDEDKVVITPTKQRFFMVNASWFKTSQVEKIAEVQ